ncbi:hypothetical protein C7M84_014239 [Penaeus vannamei]|uniref:CCHC-type domain-containing protein n=1 Tax=Penaeus vannamei TaxID=6689 RepID=A0A3R7PIH6_PENVA|nr:hypothetical protein C7M84_014239 [Penaeus vannamei]
MADNMADDRTEGTEEMAGEQVVPTRQAAGTPPPSSPVVTGVDLDTIIRLLSQTRETIERQTAQATEERAQQAAQQLQSMSELKYTLKAELDAMETRVRDYTNDVCARVKWEVKREVEEPLQAMKHQLAAVTRDVEAYRQMMALSAVLTSLQGYVLVEGNAAPWALREQNLTEVASTSWSQQNMVEEEGPSAPPLFPSPPPNTKCIPKDQLGITDVAWAAVIDKRLAEYDGKVSWNAFQAQFETVARRQGWNDEEKAYKLVISLKGAAVEVLEHLTAAQMRSYACVVRALQRRFGCRQQPEVYCAQLKTRTRRRDESLPQLAQDIEVLVGGAYPMATEETIDMLAKDSFVDALNDKQLQVHVKQAGPHNIQEALVRAAEFEAFLLTTMPSYSMHRYRGEMTISPRHIHVRRTMAKRSPPSRRTSPDGFRGICWRCGLKGHRRNECTSGGANSSRSMEDHRRPIFQPCCRACGDEDLRSARDWNREYGPAGRRAAAQQDAMSPQYTRYQQVVAPIAMRVAGKINRCPVEMVVDTGSELTFIRKDLIVSCGVPKAGQKLCGVTGDCIPMRGPVWVSLNVGDMIERLPVFVAEMEDPCLLGLDYLARVEACVDLQRRRMTVRGHEVPLILGEHALVAQTHISHYHFISSCNTRHPTVTRKGGQASSATGSNTSHLEDLVQRSIKHLTMVLVTKKDGSKRFCVDYRALNAVTVIDAYPLPRIDDTLDALSKGLWHFNVMPFGLWNAPGCFELLMEQVLEGLQWKVALVYLDDVLVFGNTFEEELEYLTEVLCRFKAAT